MFHNVGRINLFFADRVVEVYRRLLHTLLQLMIETLPASVLPIPRQMLLLHLKLFVGALSLLRVNAFVVPFVYVGLGLYKHSSWRLLLYQQLVLSAQISWMQKVLWFESIDTAYSFVFDGWCLKSKLLVVLSTIASLASRAHRHTLDDFRMFRRFIFNWICWFLASVRMVFH